MQSWEYLHLTIENKGQVGWIIRKPDNTVIHSQTSVDYIQQLGLEGWEMVSAAVFDGETDTPDQILWFKRPRLSESDKQTYSDLAATFKRDQ